LSSTGDNVLVTPHKDRNSNNTNTNNTNNSNHNDNSTYKNEKDNKNNNSNSNNNNDLLSSLSPTPSPYRMTHFVTSSELSTPITENSKLRLDNTHESSFISSSGLKEYNYYFFALLLSLLLLLLLLALKLKQFREQDEEDIFGDLEMAIEDLSNITIKDNNEKKLRNDLPSSASKYTSIMKNDKVIVLNNNDKGDNDDNNIYYYYFNYYIY